LDDDLRDKRRIGQRRQLDQSDAPAPFSFERCRQLQSQPRLARPSNPDEGDQARIPQQLSRARQLTLTADEAGERDR
jgi:hypothetical protein